MDKLDLNKPIPKPMKKASLILLMFLASAGVANPSFSQSCPADIGKYGYVDGLGGSFGETLMSLNMNRPHCVCKLNKQWMKVADGGSHYADWLKTCNQ